MIDLTANHSEEALDDFSKAIELCNKNDTEFIDQVKYNIELVKGIS